MTGVQTCALPISAKAAFSYSKKVDLSFSASTDSKVVKVSAVAKDGNYPHAATVMANGNATMEIGLKVQVSLELAGIANVKAWIRPTISGSAQFSYPAFLPSSSSKDQLCQKYHLVEDHLAFELPMGASAKVADADWGCQAQLINPIIIHDGCWFAVNSRDPLTQYVLEFIGNISDFIGTSLERSLLQSGLATEVASALKISPSQVLIEVRTSLQPGNPAGQIGFSISVSVISNSSSTSHSLGQRLIDQAEFKDSALWSQPLMSKFQGAFSIAYSNISNKNVFDFALLAFIIITTLSIAML